jgi:hypothetical protein
MVLVATLLAGMPGVAVADASQVFTPLTAPLPSDAMTSSVGFAGQMLAVSCPSLDACAAAGNYSPAGGLVRPMLLLRSGGVWTSVAAPAPAGSDPEVVSVRCFAWGGCLGMGDDADASGHRHPLLWKEVGGSWSLVPLVLPADAKSDGEGVLASSACPTSTWCVVTGSYVSATNGTQGLVLTLNGGSWLPLRAPLPMNAVSFQDAGLGDISCWAVNGCIAVGSFTGLDSTATHVGARGLIVQLNEGAPFTQEAPLPADADPNPAAQVRRVQCFGFNDCTAIGGYSTQSVPSNDAQGLLLRRSGPFWSATRAPLPSDGPATVGVVELSDLACDPAGVCRAVGMYSVPSRFPVTDGLFLTDTTSGWFADHAPAPPDAASAAAVPEAIACPAADVCSSVGYYSNAEGWERGAVFSLANGSWAVGAALYPHDAQSDAQASLDAVSCAGADFCVAAGKYSNDAAQGLLEEIAGTSPPPALPEAPTALILPLLAVAVGLVTLRRRRTARSNATPA